MGSRGERSTYLEEVAVVLNDALEHSDDVLRVVVDRLFEKFVERPADLVRLPLGAHSVHVAT